MVSSVAILLLSFFLWVQVAEDCQVDPNGEYVGRVWLEHDGEGELDLLVVDLVGPRVLHHFPNVLLA